MKQTGMEGPVSPTSPESLSGSPPESRDGHWSRGSGGRRRSLQRRSTSPAPADGGTAGGVAVVARFRPLNEAEEHAVSLLNEKPPFALSDGKTVEGTRRGVRYCRSNRVLDTSEPQGVVYEVWCLLPVQSLNVCVYQATAQPLVHHVLEGYNAGASLQILSHVELSVAVARCVCLRSVWWGQDLQYAWKGGIPRRRDERHSPQSNVESSP